MSVIELPFGTWVTPEHQPDQLGFIHSDVSSSNRFLLHRGDNVGGKRVAWASPNGGTAEIRGATALKPRGDHNYN